MESYGKSLQNLFIKVFYAWKNFLDHLKHLYPVNTDVTHKWTYTMQTTRIQCIYSPCIFLCCLANGHLLQHSTSKVYNQNYVKYHSYKNYTKVNWL